MTDQTECRPGTIATITPPADMAVVSVPEQATGGTIPDCCDHLDMEQGHCYACYDSGHAHDPERPCPPAARALEGLTERTTDG